MLTSLAGYVLLEVPPSKILTFIKLHLTFGPQEWSLGAAIGVLIRFQFLYLLLSVHQLKHEVSISDRSFPELEVLISYIRLRSAKYHCRHVLVFIQRPRR